MKAFFTCGLMLATAVMAVPPGFAQSQAPAASPQSQPASPDRTKQQSNQNPFPEDTTTVPVMPSRDTANVPVPSNSGEKNRIPMQPGDTDPVRTPEEAATAAFAGQTSSSSSQTGLSDLLPDADDDAQPTKHGKKGREAVAEHQESAAEDENVGNYYLDNKNWRAALSRFQSALVLDPDNPDVYWGLAESQRRLGDLVNARANYLKVVDYDPDSRHGKDARKILSDPQFANAKSADSTPAATPVQ